MFINTYNQNGQKIGKIQLPDEIFGVKMAPALLRQIAVSERANQRQVIAHTKTRGDVRGGGRKPWKQKGTGRARHGSIRSPIWKGGGVAFGPTNERNFKQKINKKMNRKALLVALSGKVKDEELIVIDKIELKNGKTKEMAAAMKSVMPKGGSALLVLGGRNERIARAGRNIPASKIVDAQDLYALDLLNYKYVVITQETIDALKKRFMTHAS